VESLTNRSVGSEFGLSPDESRHVRVLRLKAGVEIELFDADGGRARAVISGEADQRVRVCVIETDTGRRDAGGTGSHGLKTCVTLAAAWPKGKRAAFLVEKCAELGVDQLIPVRYARNVVSKDEESEGVARLRRIAAEASKQSGRNDVMRIGAEAEFAGILQGFGTDTTVLLLDPRGEASLVETVLSLPKAANELLLLVGPEGGFSADEIALAAQHGVVKVRMAANVLRVETAAIAACAICKACLERGLSK